MNYTESTTSSIFNTVSDDISNMSKESYNRNETQPSLHVTCAKYIWLIYPWLYCFLGIPLNIANIVHICQKWMVTSHVVYVTLLSLVDSIALLHKLLNYQRPTFDIATTSGYCRYMQFCVEFLSQLSSWILVLLSFERAIVVRFPFSRLTILNIKRTLIYVCILSLGLVVVNFHLFFTITSYEGLACIYKPKFYAVMRQYWYLVQASLHTFFPMCLLVCSNLVIVVCLYQRKRAKYGQTQPKNSASKLHSGCDVTESTSKTDTNGSNNDLYTDKTVDAKGKTETIFLRNIKSSMKSRNCARGRNSRLLENKLRGRLLAQGERNVQKRNPDDIDRSMKPFAGSSRLPVTCIVFGRKSSKVSHDPMNNYTGEMSTKKKDTKNSKHGRVKFTIRFKYKNASCHNASVNLNTSHTSKRIWTSKSEHNRKGSLSKQRKCFAWKARIPDRIISRNQNVSCSTLFESKTSRLSASKLLVFYQQPGRQSLSHAVTRENKHSNYGAMKTRSASTPAKRVESAAFKVQFVKTTRSILVATGTFLVLTTPFGICVIYAHIHRNDDGIQSATYQLVATVASALHDLNHVANFFIYSRKINIVSWRGFVSYVTQKCKRYRNY